MNTLIRGAIARVPFLGLPTPATAAAALLARRQEPSASAELLSSTAQPAAAQPLAAPAALPAPQAAAPRAESGTEEQPADSRKAKNKANAEEEEEEEDETDREEMRAGTESAAARGRERARCLAILGHPRAAANLPMALKLVASSMGRREACALLDTAPEAATPGLGAAMQPFAGLRPGADAAPAANTHQSSWDKAAALAGLPRAGAAATAEAGSWDTARRLARIG